MKLADAGYRVVLAARRTDRLKAVADGIAERGGQAETHHLDVTDRPEVDKFAESLDRCDVFVSNAGGAIGADTVQDSSPAEWQTMYEVNVLGTLHMTQALLPKLVASGAGTIVVLSSTAGFVAYEGGGGYVAAKHALAAFLPASAEALATTAAEAADAATALGFPVALKISRRTCRIRRKPAAFASAWAMRQRFARRMTR